MTLDRSLGLLAKHAGDERQRSMIEEIARKTKEGAKLSDAMAGLAGEFPEMELKIVSVGESQNTLPQTLDRIGKTLETRYKWKMAHLGGTIYSVLIFIISLILFLLIQLGLIPIFGRLFGDMGGFLPTLTQFVVDVSFFLKRYDKLVYLFVLICLFVLIYRPAYNYIFSGLRRRGRAWSLLDGIFFTQAMELGLASGLKIDESLDIASNCVERPQLRAQLQTIKSTLSQGGKLGPELKKVKAFPGSIADLISLGEERGDLISAFSESANLAENELTSRRAFRFNGLAMGFAVVILIYTIVCIIGVYMPVFSIGNM